MTVVAVARPDHAAGLVCAGRRHGDGAQRALDVGDGALTGQAGDVGDAVQGPSVGVDAGGGASRGSGRR